MNTTTLTCRVCAQPLTPVSALRVHPACTPNTDVLATELFRLVHDAIAHQPRTLQRRIGPSEIGNPCDRRLGYKLADTPEATTRGVAWKPYVGTAVHEQFANIIARAELAAAEPGRWRVEERVNVGQIGGADVTGSCDLFDTWHGAVWDWKFTTRNKIREQYRPHGPGQQYRVQAHLYGRGWQQAGFDVRTVGVIFMTRDGEFGDRYVWNEPYNEQIALDAISRVDAIANALGALGPAFTLPTLPTSGEAYCNFCPYLDAKSTDISRSCPGHPQENTATPTLAQLIGA